MKDALDDLEQLQLLKSNVESNEDLGERDRKILELEQFVSSLEQESEKIISEGLTIDVVDSERILLDLSTTKNLINTEKLSDGIYIVNIRNNSSVVTKKITITK